MRLVRAGAWQWCVARGTGAQHWRVALARSTGVALARSTGVALARGADAWRWCVAQPVRRILARRILTSSVQQRLNR
jgi:hypothetical protein